MLLNLHVKNLALIDEVDVYFNQGLNILTGETGAGKSIIIGSINIALGSKVPKEMIRDNAAGALVELIFHIEKADQLERLKQLSIPIEEDGQVILSRKIIGGRSINKVNGESVPISTIKEMSGILIDIHGQHEHQTLLHRKKHLEILDEFGKEEIDSLKLSLQNLYKEYVDIKKELAESVLDDEQRIREIDFLKYEIDDIEQAGLIVGEDIELENQYKKLMNSRKIIEIITQIHDRTGDSGIDSVGENIGRSLRDLNSIVHYDPALESMSMTLQDIDSLLNDFNLELSAYITDLSFSREDYQKIEERLDTINRLKSKYGKTIEDILDYKSGQEEHMARLLDYELYMEQLKEKLARSESELEDLSENLSQVRKKYAVILSQKIKEGLLDLNFMEVIFEMEFLKLDHYTSNGFDDAGFLISTNPGEKIKPLGNVASGGELSRIMLAIKTVLADKDATETLIFDEIDVGISGRTAQKVSEKLAVISKNHQVICITHLPQIAAMADAHYAIEKSVKKDQGTVTDIRQLGEKEITDELARIIGGAQITDKVMESAKEMKELAYTLKNKAKLN